MGRMEGHEGVVEDTGDVWQAFSSLLERPTMVAEQLTLLEARVFSRIEYSELLHQRWSKRSMHELAPNIVRVTERFNRVAAAVAQLCIESYDESSKAHLKVFKKFVKVAKVRTA